MGSIQTYLEFDEPGLTPKPGKEAQKKQDRKPRVGRRNLKEATKYEISVPPDEILFEKSYYSISKVARMFGEKASQIRYWENEFSVLKPKKNSKGDRLFRPEDVKKLVLIHDLIRNRKFTTQGAKEYLMHSESAMEKLEMINALEKIKTFLLQIKNNL